jgi:hypothetical protein
MRWRAAPSIAATGRAASCAIALLFAASAHASNAYVIFGAGGQPCSSWLQLRAQASPDSAVLQSWVLGYITSVNANVLTVNQDVAGGSTPDALFSWIDNYCAAHPFDTIARAAGALLESLRSKRTVK